MTDERVAVVDNKNNVIGYKLRSLLTDADCWRNSLIWIEDGKGNVLLQQRTADRSVDPLKWSCATAGTVTDEDSYEQTAIRELEEEIGLTGSTLIKGNTVFCRSSFGWRWTQGYLVTCDKPVDQFHIQTEEVAQIKWVNRATVLKEIKGGDPKYTATAKYYPEIFNLD